MIQSVVDRMVDDYLMAVATACADLPESQRQELLGDLREHITAQLGDTPGEAEIRTILERLGEPTAIAAEARVGLTPRPLPPLPVATARPGISAWTVVAIVAVVVLFVVFFLAMFAGLFLAVNQAPGPVSSVP
jgi:uncharacterized membrane protein